MIADKLLRRFRGFVAMARVEETLTLARILAGRRMSWPGQGSDSTRDEPYRPVSATAVLEGGVDSHPKPVTSIEI